MLTVQWLHCLVSLFSTRAQRSFDRHSVFPPFVHIRSFSGKNVLRVALGYKHILLLTDQGVFSAGEGAYGALGQSDLHDRTSPRVIDALLGMKITDIHASMYSNMIRLADGKVMGKE